MKRLLLLRHAKSSWDEAGLADHDRPLAQRGLRDTPRMAERLRLRGACPDLVLTSSAQRAQQTAEQIARGLEIPAAGTRIEPALYLASAGEILDIIKRQDDSIDELLLVGHNPGFTLAANMLLDQLGLSNLPTAGIVALQADTPHWSEIDAATRELLYFDYPKNRKAAVGAG